MAKQKSKSGDHAVVNISFDIETRGVVLSIDGVVVPSDDIFFNKFTHDGEQHVGFSYTLEVANENGLKERRQFFLPSPEEVALDSFGKVDDRGFVSKIVHDDEKAKADVINYLQQGRESQ